jgi:hypothetical protein
LAPQFGHKAEVCGTKPPQYWQGIMIIPLLTHSFSSSIRSSASSCSLLFFMLRDCVVKTTMASKMAAPKKIPMNAITITRPSDMSECTRKRLISFVNQESIVLLPFFRIDGLTICFLIKQIIATGCSSFNCGVEKRKTQKIVAIGYLAKQEIRKAILSQRSSSAEWNFLG